MPFPYKSAQKLIHGFYPLASLFIKFSPALDLELKEAGSELDAKEYMSGALLSFTFYFFVVLSIFVMYGYRNSLLADAGIRIFMVGFSFLIAAYVFSYILVVPKWLVSKKRQELEANLLFAARHLMVQTNAGVPLFDAIVSLSEEYADDKLNYGQISKEFKKIVKEIRGGKELTTALEESTMRNPSPYYRRVVWQLANANKSGANIGTVLKDVVEFLSSEQMIMIRNYGSQLNPLALFYMLTTIIAPTMGLIFLAIASSLADLQVGEAVFGVILVVLVVIQITFIGLIKSRRPVVAL